MVLFTKGKNAMRSLPCLMLAIGTALAGCGGLAALAGKAPEISESQKPPRNVAIRLHAAPKLNVDAKGRPLALVARVYKLRQHAAFEAAPYSAFLTPGAEKEAFGADLVEVKELTLVPGQRYETLEKVTREAGYVGVVALFHSPAPQRWRLAFSALDAEKAGLTVGLHACALSAGAGAKPTTADVKPLATARCQ